MTEDKVKKEQETSKVNPIQPIQGAIEEQSLSPTDLTSSQKIDTTPPAESANEYAGKVKDYKTVVSEAKSKGIDLNNQEGVPLLDSDKERIIDNAKKLAPKELVTDVVNRINTYAQPEFQKVPELDQKRLMAQERQIRRARWADALYAFGEGLQGKTANPEAFATTRLQRQKDQEFQNYLQATEKNRNTRNAWNAQNTNETIKWLDEMANNERLDRLTREKMQAAADELKEKLMRQDRDFAEKKRHNIAMENKPTGAQDKENIPVTIQTSKNTYKLKPEEAAFMKGEVMKNSEEYRNKYPGLFEKIEEGDDIDNSGKIIKGRVYYKLNPRVSDVDLIRAYLEETKEGGQPITEQNQPSYFDKYRKEKGQPTSDIPVSETVKAGSKSVQYSQPKQTPKSDPLGLGL